LSIIDKMVRFVVANPNITARELAEMLGYAEPKSVYYWLEKAGFRGMKDFRKAVLSRSFPPPAGKAETPIAKDAPNAFLIPIYHDAKDFQGYSYLKDYLKTHLSPSSFAILLSTDEFQPLAKTGDLLIIDPKASLGEGDLLLVNKNGNNHLVRSYTFNDKFTIFVDARKPAQTLTPDFITGKVVFILKSLL